MATRDNNKIRLKALKKKSYEQKKSVYDLDSALSNITRNLFPRSQEQPEEEKQEAIDYSDKISELEKKLADTKSSNSEDADYRDRETQKSLNQLRKALTGQLESLGESTMENDKALQEAINKASDRRAQEQEPDKEEKDASESTDTPERDAYGPHNNYGRALEKVATDANTAAVDSKTTNNAVKSITAKIGEFVDLGGFKYKVTNLFGIRSGENTVPGREGKHSRGIDVVGTDAQGRSTNMPIAIADGVIKNITLDGSGEAYHPTKGSPSGGYIMDVQLPNGKVMRYMHLGKDVMLNKDRLIGKNIKRGDILHPGDNSKGSGSQTGPHTKISITSVDKKGNYLLDYDNTENDPTPYLFGKA